MAETDIRVSLLLRDPAMTDGVAQRLARLARPGDTLLLSGPLGAGKTHFARAFIRACLGPEGASAEIPSPSFTLVQSYDSPRGEIWHADLYRLWDATETVELGLDEAFGTAICLVEWPDRLGPMAPPGALRITLGFLADDPDARRIDLSGQDSVWRERLATVSAGFPAASAAPTPQGMHRT